MDEAKNEAEEELGQELSGIVSMEAVHGGELGIESVDRQTALAERRKKARGKWIRLCTRLWEAQDGSSLSRSANGYDRHSALPIEVFVRGRLPT